MEKKTELTEYEQKWFGKESSFQLFKFFKQHSSEKSDQQISNEPIVLSNDTVVMRMAMLSSENPNITPYTIDDVEKQLEETPLTGLTRKICNVNVTSGQLLLLTLGIIAQKGTIKQNSNNELVLHAPIDLVYRLKSIVSKIDTGANLRGKKYVYTPPSSKELSEIQNLLGSDDFQIQRFISNAHKAAALEEKNDHENSLGAKRMVMEIEVGYDMEKRTTT
jgi:hypothetical protein